MQIIKYNGTKEEQDKIITEKTSKGLTLTDVSNVTEGNFLGFKDADEMTNIQPSINSRLDAIEAKIDSIKTEVTKTTPLPIK